MVVQTVLHFYNNHDSWAGIDLQLEDPVGELLTPEKALALVTCSSDDSDSNDEGNQPKRSVSMRLYDEYMARLTYTLLKHRSFIQRGGRGSFIHIA